MNEVALIPWRFQEASGTRLWRWVTNHFVATIIGENNSAQWDVSDLMNSVDGTPILLTEGRTPTFADAEQQVREIVGKSYPPSLGYRQWAGKYATTFTLADGTNVDLAQFHGCDIVVVVGLGQGNTTQIIGQAFVEHYELRVAMDNGETVTVLPHRIRSIIQATGAYDQTKTMHTGIARMYQGQIEHGCTGTTGFLDNTVEHSGPRCPVHEYNTLS